MAALLASGYINLSVQYGSAMNKIARDFDVVEKQAKVSGRKAGENLSEGIDSGSQDAGRQVSENVEDGLDKPTAERIGRRFGNFLSNAIRRETKKTGKDLANDFQSSSLVSATKSFAKFSAVAGTALVALGSLGPAAVAVVAALGAVAAAAGGAAVAGMSALGVSVASIKIAMVGLDDAFKLAFDPTKVDDFNKAMAKLGPQTQAMVKGVVGLVNAWKDSGAQVAVQDALFAGLGDRFDSLKQFIEPVKTAMVAVNSAFNSAIKSVLDFVTSAQGVGLLTGWLNDSTTIVKNFAKGIGNIVPGLLAIGSAATSAFAPLTGGIGDAAKNFSDLMLQMQQSGQIQDFFTNMWDVAKQVGNALKQLVGLFAAIGSAAAAAGGGNGLALITDKLKTLNAFFSAGEGREALITFFKSAQAAMGAILPVILEVAKVIGSTLAPIIANVATTIGPSLIPAVDAIGEGIKKLAPLVEGAATAIAKLVEFITPALPILVQLAPAVLVIVGAMKAWAIATAAYTALQWLLNAALDANPIGLVVIAIAALVAGLILLFNNNKAFHDFVVNAWEAIKNAFTVAWAVIKPVLDALGQAIGWLWNNVAVPAFNGIKAVIEVWWAGAQVVFSAFKAALTAVGDAAMWLWNNAIAPAWEGIKAAVSGAWDFMSGVFENMKTGFQVVADFIRNVFNGVGDVVKGIFNGIVEVIKAPLREVGKLLQGIGNIHVPGTDIDIPAGDFGNKLAGLATGGVVTGPGNGTSDSVLAWLSNGEGVVTANAMQNGGGALVAALNAGWTPPVDMLKAMVPGLPGFAEGLSPGADFLRTELMQLFPSITTIGGKRAEDGFGEHSSGNAIDVMIPGYDTPQGKALGDAVASFIAKNKEALGADGMIWRQTSYGYGGGSWTDGKGMSDRGSPTQNHMDHVHIILGKGRGAGAPQIDVPTQSLSLPSGGSVTPGGGSSGGGGGATTPKQLQTAQDKVTDAQNRADTAQLALQEAQTKGTTGAALKTKQDSADKAKRELDQAKQDLETLKAKKDDPTKGGGTGGSDSNNPFSQIGKGIGQLADLAKGGLKESFLPPGFSDPEDWGITKMLSGLLGFGSGLVGGLPEDKFPGAKAASAILGAGGQIAGGNTGSGISALFDLIPNPNGDGSLVAPGAVTPGAALPDQFQGTGALPGPKGNPSETPLGDPTNSAVVGAGATNDNSTHIGQINGDTNQILDKTKRQQVSAQTPHLGTRRFV